MLRLAWILVLLVTVWPLTPAAAAPRVLLTAEDQAGTAGATARGSSPGTLGNLRASAQRDGTVRVIVGLRVPFAPAMSLSAAEARRQTGEIAATTSTLRQRFAAAIARAPDRVRSYHSVPFMALDVTSAELDRLATDPAVISITPDIVLTSSLMESAPMVRAPEAWAAGFTGRGQTVAVLDTGVDRFHPFLSGKVVSEACYTDRACPGGGSSSTATGSARPCSAADCSHGTHVAGIAAGRLPGGLSGIAPEARIIAIQVFTPINSQRSGANFSDVLTGLERVYALRDSFDIAAVNMSLGSVTTYSSRCDRTMPAMAAMIDQLKAAGIATVVSSGNGGISNGISMPACMSGAVSVGSVSDSNWGTCSFPGITPAPTATDMVACYSNAAEMLSLLAPGSYITSSVPNGGFAAEHGTSMAAPHVAGAFAVLAERAPTATVAEILAALRSTGRRVTDYRNSRITTPRIDVKGALDALVTDSRPILALDFVGTGRGTVSFSPAGSLASCTTSCSNRYEPGTEVTLTATPNAQTTFAGWSGACSGTGSCSVTMTDARQVSAVFQAVSSGPPQVLSLATSGSGTGSLSVSADGATQQCSGACTMSFGQGTSVTLTAEPAPGTALVGWSGACRGRKASCVVRMTTAKTVNASFVALPSLMLAYSKAGSGDGVIDIDAGGSVTSCGTSCTTSFFAGTAIRLTAKPAAGKTFAGWTGICRGRKATCTFKLKKQASVSATFN